MANRHLARSIALQSLYEWDFSGRHDEVLNDIVERNVAEFASGLGDSGFVKKIINGIVDKSVDLDKIITTAAPDWPLEKIATVDRNVLRIGLFELLFADKEEVPAKVAINEAIELAKTFGGENSGRFVNGVLGSVYKEMGEPGKDALPRKKKIKDVPFEDMPIQKLGGAVVYAMHENEIYMAFVHDIFGHWTLSKGKIEAGEDEKLGTLREIKEEMGLDITIKAVLGNNEYVASDPELGKIRKQVSYFLAEAQYVDLVLGPSGGLDDARWFKMFDILELNFSGDILPIVTKSVNILLGGALKEESK